LSNITELLETCRTNYSHIRKQIDDYGNTIHKRWSKRNESKWKQLILSQKPDLYPRKHVAADILFMAMRYRWGDLADRLSQVDPTSMYEDTNLIPFWIFQHLVKVDSP
jgi:hypothetical protein